jgi:hypothetical protein
MTSDVLSLPVGTPPPEKVVTVLTSQLVKLLPTVPGFAATSNPEPITSPEIVELLILLLADGVATTGKPIVIPIFNDVVILQLFTRLLSALVLNVIVSILQSLKVLLSAPVTVTTGDSHPTKEFSIEPPMISMAPNKQLDM